MIDKKAIKRLARCIYLASSELNPPSKSREAHRNAIFSHLFHYGTAARASIEAIEWQGRATQTTIDRIERAISFVRDRTDRIEPDFPTSGSHEIGDVVLRYDIPTYGSFVPYSGGRIRPAIIHISYQEDPTYLWDNEDSWQYQAALSAMMFDALCARIESAEKFWAAVQNFSMGRIPGHFGMRGKVGILHLSVDAADIYPPLVKPVVISPEPIDLIKFFLKVRAVAYEAEQLRNFRDEYYPGISAKINASKSKCRGKYPCPLLAECHYGRYDIEQLYPLQIS